MPETVAHCDCDGNGWVSCYECYGKGYHVVCPDDLCRGADECMHSDDGEDMCRECEGRGEVRCSCNPLEAQ